MISRRSVLGGLALGGAVRRLGAAAPEIPQGPFRGTRKSLRDYRAPEWYRDAKFGIWAHWGPQSHIEFGDWYARWMYEEGSRQYKHHVATYGHPSKVGYKDVAVKWRAENFDPDYLVGLYKKAGARYFCSMGVHHDNFDLWNSKFQPKWNSVAIGPKKDIVDLFRKAALRHGLRFGVSEHLAASYHWFQTSHGADKAGRYAGVPYDGTNRADWDLYHETHLVPKTPKGDDDFSSAVNVPEAWKRRYFDRIRDLVDRYDPDLLYTDGGIFYEEYGLALVAHHYNRGARRQGGVTEAVYTSKRQEDCEGGACVLDLERGVVDRIWDDPWQTDTCIGQWHYKKGQRYKSAKTVIDMLVDIVSRNGNLMLNLPLNSKGELDAEEMVILDGITRWMAVNSEGIYGTRPWRTTAAPTPAASDHAAFSENKRQALSADDMRFTRKGDILYAFCMGVPQNDVVISPLGTKSPDSRKVQNVELLGFKGRIESVQDETGLRIRPPARMPDLPTEAVVFKIFG